MGNIARTGAGINEIRTRFDNLNTLTLDNAKLGNALKSAGTLVLAGGTSSLVTGVSSTANVNLSGSTLTVNDNVAVGGTSAFT